MPQNKNLESILSNKLFSGIKSPDFKLSTHQNRFLNFMEGDIIYQQGDASDCIYLIMEGEVKVKIPLQAGISNIYRKGKDEFFGEKEIFGKSKRSSSAVANTDCILYKIIKKDLNDLVKKNKTLNDNIRKTNIPPDKDSGTEDVSPEQTPDEPEKDVNENEKTQTDVDSLNEQDSVEAETPDTNIDFSAGEEDFIIAADENQQALTDSIKAELGLIETTHPEENSASAEKDKTGDEDSTFILNEETSSGFDDNAGKIDESDSYKMDPDEETLSVEDETTGNDLMLSEDEENYEIPEEENLLDDISDFTPPEDKTETPDEELQDDVPVEDTTGEYTLPESIEPTAGPAKDEFEEPRDLPESPANAEAEEELDAEEKHESAEALTVGESRTDYQALIEAAEKIHANIRYAKTAAGAVAVMSEIFGSETGKLFIYDASKEQLWYMNESLNSRREFIKMNTGIAGYAAGSGEKIVIYNVSGDERFDIAVDSIPGRETFDLLCVPFKDSGGALFGVLELINCVQDEFNELDTESLNILTRTVINAAANSLKAEELINESRISSLGEIAGFLLEDVKTASLMIKQYVQFLLKKEMSFEEAQAAGLIDMQSDSIINYIETTLDYVNGRTSINAETVSLSAAMDGVLDLLAEYVESRNVKLFKRYETDKEVKLDKIAFYQAFFQLSKNSCDAMPGGGEIYIVVREEDDSIVLEFKDTGPGIPNEINDKLFEPFFSFGKKKTGFGLAIAKKIIEDHGGQIKLTGSSGEGSAFEIRLHPAG